MSRGGSLAFWFVPLAVGAKPFQNVVGGMQVEAFGQVHLRDGQPPQAEGPLAAFAVEVGVQPGEPHVYVFPAMAVLGAYGVFHLAAAVFDAVHEMVAEEERQRPEYGGLVHRDELVLQVADGHGAVHFFHRAQDEQAHGRRLYAA